MDMYSFQLKLRKVSGIIKFKSEILVATQPPVRLAIIATHLYQHSCQWQFAQNTELCSSYIFSCSFCDITEKFLLVALVFSVISARSSMSLIVDLQHSAEKTFKKIFLVHKILCLQKIY
jgi:hypothetical protein